MLYHEVQSQITRDWVSAEGALLLSWFLFIGYCFLVRVMVGLSVGYVWVFFGNRLETVWKPTGNRLGYEWMQKVT